MSNPHRIVVTAEAFSNLEEITDYIGRSSPQNAASVRQRLGDAIDSLAHSPGRYKRVGTSRSHQSPIHAMVVRPFIVYYQIQS